MSNRGGARIWQFLRRNPAYIEAWQDAKAAAPEEPAPFPLRMQTAADRRKRCRKATYHIVSSLSDFGVGFRL